MENRFQLLTAPQRRRLMTTLLAGALLAGTAASLGKAEDERQVEARQLTAKLFEQLSTELTTAMQEGGPEAAIRVCRDLAPAIKAELSLQSGAQVTRVGTRVRNPLLGQPNAREREVLEEFQLQHDAGTAFADMEHFEILQAGSHRQALYMRPIAIQPPCLSCHGATDELSPAVKTALQDSYPQDAATGYSLGELRGAFSVTYDLKD